MNLEEEVKLLREEMKLLRQENKSLRKRIEELEELVKEKSKPSFVKEDVKEEPKITGQKEGHKGYSRRIPERIDEIKPLDSEECKYCGEKLSGIQNVRARTITDIEVKVINTQYIIHGRYCKNCGRIVEPDVNDALPNARFSLKLMLFIMLMKIGIRIPSNKITEFFGILGLEISDGEVYNILNRLKEAFGNYYETLVKRMQEAATKHIDETSWRINGQNNWLWIFVNKEVALYVVEKQRSSEVPIEVLGNQKDKFVTTDRHSAYNVLVEKTGCLQQVCWTHLIRNSKDLSEHYREAKYIHKRMKYIYRKAKERKTSKEKLLHWIDLFASRAYTSKEVFRFVKSICRNHREDLFRFVDNPEINPSNNLAEQWLRPAVVIRKVSGGSRSENGAETTAKLLSVMQTIKMQEGNIIENMANLLQKGK
ncbi:MAG: IS66 family transposase [Nanoarchaeota archaeon]